MSDFPEPRRSLIAQAAVAAVLIAAVSAPALDLAVNGEDPESVLRELRKPAPRPALSLDPKALAEFPGHFDLWFQDAFGLRDVLIRSHNRLAVFGFGLSPVRTLLIGEKEWVFHVEQKAMETFRGAEPFEIWEMEHWQRCLELRRDFVVSQGGVFVVSFVPSKLEVYHELIPKRFTRLGPSRRVQLLEHLKEHSDLRIVDLLPALTAEKELDRPDRHVYYPHGVHWTDSGAAAASRVLLGALEGTPFEMTPLGRDAFETQYDHPHQDSWARRLHLEGEIVDQETGLDRIGGWKATKKRSGRRDYRKDRHFKQDDQSLPTAALFHDSMGPWLLPFLGEHFSRIDGLRRLNFSPRVLTELQPDVVFEVYSERQLATRWPVVPALSIQERLGRAFDASSDVRLLVDVTEDLELEPRLNEAALHRAEETLEIVVETGKHALMIPSFDASFPTAANEFLLLKLDFESAGKSQVDAAFKTSPTDTFDGVRSYSVEGRKGRHVVYIPMSNPRMLGEGLLLRLGTTPGRYVLHHLEIRAVRDE